MEHKQKMFLGTVCWILANLVAVIVDPLLVICTNLLMFAMLLFRPE